MVDQAIAPSVAALRAIGFRGSKRTFYRISGETSVVFHVESSRWNYGPFASFTVRLGCYAPKIAKRLGRDVLPSPPKSGEGCMWYPDIDGFLKRTPGSPLRWNIPQDFSMDDAAEDLLHVTKTIAIPLLERMTDLDGFCEAVLHYGGLTGADKLWRLGRKADAHKCARAELQRTKTMFEGPKYAKVVREWMKMHSLRAA